MERGEDALVVDKEEEDNNVVEERKERNLGIEKKNCLDDLSKLNEKVREKRR